MTEKQLKTCVALWQTRLGLSLWSIEVKTGEVEAVHAYADCARSVSYDRATITFCGYLVTPDGQPNSDRTMAVPTTQPDRDVWIERLVVHELLHCSLRDTQAAALDDIDGMLHRDVYSVFESSYHRAEEQAIDRLATALVKSFS
jgi:hypothetical protein